MGMLRRQVEQVEQTLKTIRESIAIFDKQIKSLRKEFIQRKVRRRSQVGSVLTNFFSARANARASSLQRKLDEAPTGIDANPGSQNDSLTAYHNCLNAFNQELISQLKVLSVCFGKIQKKLNDVVQQQAIQDILISLERYTKIVNQDDKDDGVEVEVVLWFGQLDKRVGNLLFDIRRDSLDSSSSSSSSEETSEDDNTMGSDHGDVHLGSPISQLSALKTRLSHLIRMRVGQSTIPVEGGEGLFTPRHSDSVPVTGDEVIVHPVVRGAHFKTVTQPQSEEVVSTDKKNQDDKGYVRKKTRRRSTNKDELVLRRKGSGARFKTVTQPQSEEVVSTDKKTQDDKGYVRKKTRRRSINKPESDFMIDFRVRISSRVTGGSGKKYTHILGRFAYPRATVKHVKPPTKKPLQSRIKRSSVSQDKRVNRSELPLTPQDNGGGDFVKPRVSTASKADAKPSESTGSRTRKGVHTNRIKRQPYTRWGFGSAKDIISIGLLPRARCKVGDTETQKPTYAYTPSAGGVETLCIKLYDTRYPKLGTPGDVAVFFVEDVNNLDLFILNLKELLCHASCLLPVKAKTYILYQMSEIYLKLKTGQCVECHFDLSDIYARDKDLAREASQMLAIYDSFKIRRYIKDSYKALEIRLGQDAALPEIELKKQLSEICDNIVRLNYLLSADDSSYSAVLDAMARIEESIMLFASGASAFAFYAALFRYGHVIDRLESYLVKLKSDLPHKKWPSTCVLNDEYAIRFNAKKVVDMADFSKFFLTLSKYAKSLKSRLSSKSEGYRSFSQRYEAIKASENKNTLFLNKIEKVEKVLDTPSHRRQFFHNKKQYDLDMDMMEHMQDRPPTGSQKKKG